MPNEGRLEYAGGDERLPAGAERASGRLRRWLGSPAVRYAVILFVAARLFLSLWAIVALTVSPLPAEADEVVRPYLGEPILAEGAAGLLLGPWQRFDALHYLRIARQGYADVADSVFPPLYPLAIRALGGPLRLLLPEGQANLLAAILIGNTAMVAAFALLYRVASAELAEKGAATRTLVYLVFFPTAFFWLAPYTEPLFLLLALGAIWEARRGRFWWAGLLGFLAALTRLTGWGLVMPLAYEYGRQRGMLHQLGNLRQWRKLDGAAVACLLPAVGLLAFVAGRAWLGLPPLATIYREFWHQTTTFPGVDVLRVLGWIVQGEAGFTFIFDLLCLLFLMVTTVLVFRRLGATYGLYSAMMLLFMLLPTSELKPLYSFSRYTLTFFPTFMLLGAAGRNPWMNRLVLYPSFALYLYFSGQFFIWGWVA
jgi:hypothetical protein